MTLQLPEAEVRQRLRLDNPWWEVPTLDDDPLASFPKRDYFEQFARLVREESVRRAVILIGPRRVGKTVMVGQLVRELLADGVEGRRILYLSLDTPVYTGLTLERLLTLFREEHEHSRTAKLFVFFDEVQYHRDWERHLKSLVDSYANVRFVATGSAAAALKRQSTESGAGRFTDFLLPPLTFSEFLHFIGRDREQGRRVWKALGSAEPGDFPLDPAWVARLNADFVDYLNYGGYPESVLNEAIRRDSTRFVRDDIIGKVLLRDLPNLYGIPNTQELNHLFTMLAYNTGNEISLEALTQASGIAKQTIQRYLTYLEAAFLIRRVVRVDETARHLKRQRTFKVYLTNPSMRGALFGAVDADGPDMGRLAETAVFSQFLHAPDADLLRYARWKAGRRDCEVDLVSLDRATQKPWAIAEVKWSDRPLKDVSEVEPAIRFAASHHQALLVTTRARASVRTVGATTVWFVPVAIWCQVVGEIMVGQSLRTWSLRERMDRVRTEFEGSTLDAA